MLGAAEAFRIGIEQRRAGRAGLPGLSLTWDTRVVGVFPIRLSIDTVEAWQAAGRGRKQAGKAGPDERLDLGGALREARDFRRQVVMQPDSDPFQVAVSAHQEGDIHGAAIAYELILRDDPLHAGAWHLLGVARQQQGCSGEAVECIRRALAIDDSKAVYHNNLGASLLELGLYAEAESAFRRAIELNRDYADAWSNLGRALHLLHSSFEEAERALLGALALRSDHPEIGRAHV